MEEAKSTKEQEEKNADNKAQNKQQQVENTDTEYQVSESPYADFNTGNTEPDQKDKEE